MLPHPHLHVAIQDPPFRRSVLPMFPGFLCFAPRPPGRPRVAIYVPRMLDRHLSFSNVFQDYSGMLSMDILSPEGLFGFPHRSLRVTSVYLLRTNRPPYGSIPPERLLAFLSYPHLVLGDFNIHHPLADTCRSLSESAFTISARYLDLTFDVLYHLLNTYGVYTWFPFDIIFATLRFGSGLGEYCSLPSRLLMGHPPPLHRFRSRSVCDNTKDTRGYATLPYTTLDPPRPG